MLNIIKEISYLKGYFEASNIDENSKEFNIFKRMIDIIEVMGDKIVTLEDSKLAFDDFLESLNEYSEQITNQESNCINTENNNNKIKDSLEELNDSWSNLECKYCGEITYISEEKLYDSQDISCCNCDKIILSNDEECKIEE